ncbi:MAG TPA: helix-turn-helix transcriptional regulator [Vicinamibacteria bacterium]|nr:helix-turn-helix transcriptional regulator [Vicinamibacteria bacterium]
MRGIFREALKGHLDLMVLAALEREPAHGYAIIGEIRRRTRGTFDLADGTIYPALQRLEDAGLLRSSWTLVNGRSRRVYGLTARGRTELASRRRGWRTFSLAVSRAIG